MSCSSNEESDDSSQEVEDGPGCSEYEGFSEESEDGVETKSDSESAEGLGKSDISKSEHPPPSEWIEFNKKVKLAYSST